MSELFLFVYNENIEAGVVSGRRKLEKIIDTRDVSYFYRNIIIIIEKYGRKIPRILIIKAGNLSCPIPALS